MRSLVIALILTVAPFALAYTPITLSQLEQIMPQGNSASLSSYLPYLNSAMQQYNINTPNRQAGFLGQVAEETGELNDMTEIGDADGTTYQGRGALQLTGEANYQAASNAMGVNFVSNPSLVSEPQYAFSTAAWYWNSRNLNADADAGNWNAITQAINGCVTCAVTHNAQRMAFTQTALKVLGGNSSGSTPSSSSSSTPSSGSSPSSGSGSSPSSGKSSGSSPSSGKSSGSKSGKSSGSKSGKSSGSKSGSGKSSGSSSPSSNSEEDFFAGFLHF